MVLHTYKHVTPGLRKLKQEDIEVQISLGYMARSYLKKQKREKEEGREASGGWGQGRGQLNVSI